MSRSAKILAGIALTFLTAAVAKPEAIDALVGNDVRAMRSAPALVGLRPEPVPVSAIWRPSLSQLGETE